MPFPFDALGLGHMAEPPEPLTGGLMHEVYRLKTDRGAFAVKLIDPEVAARPGAIGNIENSEGIAAALAGVVPVAAAIAFDGHYLRKIAGRWAVVYPWAEGESVFPPRITPAHCAAIGDALGQMHAANVRLPGLEPETEAMPEIDWPGLLARSPEAPWRARLERALPDLMHWSEEALAAEGRLADAPVLSHRDLDPKNVLWRGLSPVLIDWEAAGYVNPRRELLEVLLYWADDGAGGLVAANAEALLAAYREHMPTDGCWADVFAAGRGNTLQWLAHSMRQASDSQVAATLDGLARYQDNTRQLRDILG